MKGELGRGETGLDTRLTPRAAAIHLQLVRARAPTVSTLLVRMNPQPVFRCASLSTLDTGSGRETPTVCHGSGV